MIIVLKNADFSQSNIGTLSTWRISRSLGAGATYEGPTSVDKGAELDAELYISPGYSISSVGITVTMGGILVDNAVEYGGFESDENGVYVTERYYITIPSVTGNVVIKVPTVNINTGEEEEPEIPDVSRSAVVDLVLTSTTNNVLLNAGTGGSAYNGTIITPSTSDSYSVSSDGLTLVKKAYANVPYGFAASDNFTIRVTGKFDQFSENKYERFMRTDVDTPSIYRSQSAQGTGFKLAGQTGNAGTAIGPLVNSWQSGINTVYAPDTKMNSQITHTYVFVGNGDKIYLYIDGVLQASQNAANMKTSTYIGLGNNDTSVTYNAAQITVQNFCIYNYAMTAEEVAALEI